MPVGEEQINGAVVVVVEVLESPAAQQARGLCHAIRLCNIAKGLVLIVLIDGKHFVINIGYEQILPASPSQVRSVHSHAGARPATFAESDAGLQGDFVPIPAAI